MKQQTLLTAFLNIGAFAFTVATQCALAQDAIKVDSIHHSVVLENDQVRVLRVTYGAFEKSVMHDHPASVAVFLTDQTVRFTLADGKTVNATGKAGQVVWTSGEKHLPENLSDKQIQMILVELKQKTTKGK